MSHSCHMSHTCHMPHVTCRMSHVAYMSHAPPVARQELARQRLDYERQVRSPSPDMAHPNMEARCSGVRP
eukprot:690795-Prymnesium_polylepis.1